MAISPAQAAPPSATAAPDMPDMSTRRAARRRIFTVIGGVVLAIASLWVAYYWLIGSNYVSTEDAYVGAEVAVVTPQVAGAVAEVAVRDTQQVHKGDILVRVDPTDAQLAVAQAEAAYASAQRRVRGLLANDQSNAASLSARSADVAHAQAMLASADSGLGRARTELRRREALAKTGVVSGEELTTALANLQTADASHKAAVADLAQARANLGTARGQRAAGLALTEGGDVERNPEVAAARVALDVARLNLARTVIRAPVDGIVAKRRVQVGQRIAVGADLLTIVPLSQLFVDANFKEVQLERVEPGQPVELVADRYGSSVVFRGRVVGIGGGTGSAFATIPAQNATGNWIKVVQRLPVRIALDPAELAAHPLRVGLSMNVTIDIRQRRGAAGAAK